jgi:hypothetical protein
MMQLVTALSDLPWGAITVAIIVIIVAGEALAAMFPPDR